MSYLQNRIVMVCRTISAVAITMCLTAFAVCFCIYVLANLLGVL